jgi:hypothetical protein
MMGLRGNLAGRGSAMDERSARLAANEAVFRAGNESIEKVTRGTEQTEFLCECGDPQCFQLFANQTNLCSAGRGGGNFEP